MIFYVVTDSPANYQREDNWHHNQCTLERLAGDVCLTLSYQSVGRKLLAELRPWAVVHSGAHANLDEHAIVKHRGYRELVRHYGAAQIGLCGGHQSVAAVLGCPCGPMRKLRPGEPDLADFAPGQFKEYGMYAVRIVWPDPLWAGFAPAPGLDGETVIRVREHHGWEVRELTRDLVLLASSDGCRVQAYRHKTRLIYGTQFHPEHATPAHPDGWRVLTNFFRIARQHWRAGLPNRAQ